MAVSVQDLINQKEKIEQKKQEHLISLPASG